MKKLILLLFPVVILASIHPQPNTVDMVLHYKLDYGYNWIAAAEYYVFDYTLNGCTGRCRGTTAFIYPGVDLDGDSDFIFTSSEFYLTFRDSFTILLWVKPDDGVPASYEVLIGAIHDTSPLEDVIHITIQDTGKIRFTFESNDNAAYAEEAAATFSNGAQPWTCIVVTAQADVALNIYVNGELQAIGAGANGGGDASGITFADFETDCNLNVGALNSDNTFDGYHSHFAGLIGDCRIYERAVTPTEIKNYYEVTRWHYSR